MYTLDDIKKEDQEIASAITTNLSARTATSSLLLLRTG